METPFFSASVKDTWTFDHVSSDTLNLVPAGPSSFHIIHNNQSLLAEILDLDLNAKMATIRINGTNFEVKIEDKLDRLVRELGLGLHAGQKVSEIKAPMPGLVLDISVKVGETIEKGQQLLILEAMKMENVIKSPGEGVIKAIPVEKGAAVEKGAILIELD